MALDRPVDALLALVLLVGAVIGAQYGTRAGAKLKAGQLRALLALLVLGVCGRLAWGLVSVPDDLYVIGKVFGGA